jgi:acyl carrier protein
MPYTDETLTQVRALLSSVLQLGEKARTLDAGSPLLGALPELDSIGVVISDDEMSAEIFATLGSLAEFVEAKIAGQ